MYFCINNVTVTYNYALYTKSMFFISPLHSLDKNYDKKAFFCITSLGSLCSDYENILLSTRLLLKGDLEKKAIIFHIIFLSSPQHSMHHDHNKNYIALASLLTIKAISRANFILVDWYGHLKKCLLKSKKLIC